MGGHPRRLIALLVVVLVANVALCGAWMYRNGFFVRPLPAEHATCRYHAVQMLLAAERGLAPAVRAVLGYEHWHGPVMPASAAVVGLALRDRAVGPLSTWITTCVLFGSLLLLGTWRLATGVGLGPRVAVAAVALAAAAPVIGCYQRVFFQQMPMAALVTLALGEMVRTAGFTRFGASVRTGLLVGLAVLAKNIAPMYLLGPALAELLLHRPPGGGRRALCGAGAALTIAATMVTPWLALNWQYVKEYVKYGTYFDSNDMPWWDLARWKYHLLACANNGFGLIPICVLAGLVLLRRRLPARSTDLRVPAAQVVVTYPLLALLQPIAQSYFQVSWMPVLAIVTVELARRAAIEMPRVGRWATSLLVVGALVNVALVQRGLYVDRAGVSWLGIELPPRSDHYLGAGVVVVQVVASSDPERWPVDEFADAILRRPHEGLPVIVTTHPFLCAANLGCAALVAGSELSGRTFMPTSPEELWRDLTDGAYFVHDDLYGDLGSGLAWLAERGVRTEVVARLPVIKDRCATLLQVTGATATRPR